jgi:alpha-1,2-mannosyltransferase
MRMALAAVCSFAEARFYRTITEEINPHVGRYVFCILFFGAGMFNASTGKKKLKKKKVTCILIT